MLALTRLRLQMFIVAGTARSGFRARHSTRNEDSAIFAADERRPYG
jgi:hypothetical protein